MVTSARLNAGTKERIQDVTITSAMTPSRVRSTVVANVSRAPISITSRKTTWASLGRARRASLWALMCRSVRASTSLGSTPTAAVVTVAVYRGPYAFHAFLIARFITRSAMRPRYRDEPTDAQNCTPLPVPHAGLARQRQEGREHHDGGWDERTASPGGSRDLSREAPHDGHHVARTRGVRKPLPAWNSLRRSLDPFGHSRHTFARYSSCL